MGCSSYTSKSNKGSVLILVLVSTLAMLSMLALTIDLGIRFMVYRELTGAAKSAALYGADQLQSGASLSTIQSRATTALQNNKCFGGVTPTLTTISVGRWKNNSYTQQASGTPTNNAVKLQGSCTGTYYFASLFTSANFTQLVSVVAYNPSSSYSKVIQITSP